MLDLTINLDALSPDRLAELYVWLKKVRQHADAEIVKATGEANCGDDFAEYIEEASK